MSDHVGFVGEPNCGRGTIGIFWQCLTTMFLCAYTVLHFNVPIRPLSKTEILRRNLLWFTLTVCAPEFTFIAAFDEYITVRQLKRIAKKHPSASLTKKQAFLTVSGGVDLFIDGIRSSQAGQKWSIDKDGENLVDEDNGTSVGFHEFIISLPSDDEIDGRSKADFLGKLITVFQATWMASTVVARLATGLLVTPLETCTCASVFLALSLCFLWWNKPYNITSKFTIHLSSSNKENTTNPHLPQTRVKDLEGASPQLCSFDALASVGDDCWSIYMTNGQSSKWDAVIVIAMGTSYIAIHAAAWNYGFSTLIEAWFWRGATITMLVSFLVLVSSCFWIDEGNDIPTWLVMVILLSYIVARLSIVVEMFAAFRSAPAGIYQDLEWSSYIGHIGG